MSTIGIKVPPAEIHIHADRRLAFQVLSAFGAGKGPTGASSRVLDAGAGSNEMGVEFHSPATGPFGREVVYRTVERVRLNEPESIEFEGVEGPFDLLHDKLVLNIEEGCTRLRYESEFGIRGWIFGWFVGVCYAKRKLERFMRNHVLEMKQTIEERAERSKVFSDCSLAHAEQRERERERA